MVNLRWESRDGVASSFVETVWDKVPAHDMLSYDPSDATVRLTLSSETLLLEPSVKVGPAGIARFDIRGLQDHISQMAICAKQLTKDSGTK